MYSIDDIDDTLIVNMLFDTNMTNREIAAELRLTEKEVVAKIKALGLGWLRKRSGHASRGQAALTKLMRKLLPGEEILSEHQLGERLRLDVYCPRYKLAAEFHGRQHFEYVDHFHHDQFGYEDHQQRDRRKEQLCLDQGIILVVFRYNDLLTETAVFERLLQAIQDAPPLPEKDRKPVKNTQFYESMRQRQREYRKLTYRKMKGESGRAQRKAS